MSNIEFSGQARSAQRMYNARAHEYDDSWHPKFAADIAKWAAVKPGDQVLDLACGTGLVTLAIANFLKHAPYEQKGHIVAVDVTDGMLSRARVSSTDHGVEDLITFIKHDITQLDTCPSDAIQESSFDIITCASCLPLLKDPDSAIKHWIPYLKPGGRMVADVPSAESQVPGLLFEQSVRANGTSLFWSRSWIEAERSLEKLYEDAGLVIERSLRVDGYRSAKGPYPIEDGEKIIDSFLQSPASLELAHLDENVRSAIKEDFLRRWQDRATDGMVDELEGFYVVIGIKK